MAKASAIQASFSGGEISPLSYGRVDNPRYKESLAICLNYIPLIQGPITRRPGTQFVGRCQYASQKSRLIPFVATATSPYVVEFTGNGLIRFYQNGAVVTGTKVNITSVTNAKPPTMVIDAGPSA